MDGRPLAAAACACDCVSVVCISCVRVRICVRISSVGACVRNSSDVNHE